MSLFKARSRTAKHPTLVPVIETLESRAYLSVADLGITVAGPLPTTAIAGDVVNTHIGVNLANNGAGTAKGRVTITLFASPDDILDVGDAQIVPKGEVLHIPTGRNKTFKIPVKRFPQNLNGDYFVLAQVTGNGVTAATAASNGTVHIAPPNVNLADQITKVALKGRVGHRIGVNVFVANNGNFQAKGTLAIGFAASPNADGSASFSLGTLPKHISIKPGKHSTLKLQLPLPVGIATGNLYIIATVDPANVFLDPDITDNVSVSSSPVGVT